MLIMRTHVKREPCKRCQILRLYLLMVIMVAVVGVAMGHRLAPIGGISPIFFGGVFAGLAVLTFAVKYVLWQREKYAQQQNSSENDAV